MDREKTRVSASEKQSGDGFFFSFKALFSPEANLRIIRSRHNAKTKHFEVTVFHRNLRKNIELMSN